MATTFYYDYITNDKPMDKGYFIGLSTTGDKVFCHISNIKVQHIRDMMKKGILSSWPVLYKKTEKGFAVEEYIYSKKDLKKYYLDNQNRIVCNSNDGGIQAEYNKYMGELEDDLNSEAWNWDNY